MSKGTKRPIVIALFCLAMASFSSLFGQESEKTLPRVIEHRDPILSPLARQARIEGEVQVKFTTNGESVVSAEAVSGNPLLTKSAEDSVRTWRFAPHKAGEFLVTFRFRFQSDHTLVRFLESPGIVDVEEPVPEVSINYSTIDLGRWKARLRSPKGNLLRTIALSATGASLDGAMEGPDGTAATIDDGYYEDDLISFSVVMTRPDGKRVKALFIGRLGKKTSVGAFVDETGVTGTWSAVYLGATYPRK